MSGTHQDGEGLAARVRELREERGLSQKALAQAAGFDASTMSRIESGERGLSAGDVVALARALGADVGALLRVDEPAVAFRANCSAGEIEESLKEFREVIADLFAVEALAR
jgi:transcriptional regulator with XRE-family HTH domain